MVRVGGRLKNFFAFGQKSDKRKADWTPRLVPDGTNVNQRLGIICNPLIRLQFAQPGYVQTSLACPSCLSLYAKLA